MSRSRPQTVTGKISFGNVDVQKHVSISALNNVPLENFKKRSLPNFSSYEDLEKLLLSGGFAVDGNITNVALVLSFIFYFGRSVFHKPCLLQHSN